MKTYEYKVLQETETVLFRLEDVNKLGAEGWRVVSWSVDDRGYETVLMEKESVV